MATYIIGDIQGCYLSLRALLNKFTYSPHQDQLYLLGDLVNRGPRSLEVLRWARREGARVAAVLGNHDLHLIGRYLEIFPEKKGDSLGDILKAPDRDELILWLRNQPLVIQFKNHWLVHGGILPFWEPDQVLSWAEQVHQILVGPNPERLLSGLPGRTEIYWDKIQDPFSRLQKFTKILTRIRICLASGVVPFSFSASLEEIPPPYRPWFLWPLPKWQKQKIYFGHWSALGYYPSNQTIGLDTGCVWGKQLSALRLEDQVLFQAPYQD